MENFNTAKRIATIIFSTALSCAFSVLFTLSIFSYVSDFRYFPQCYNILKDIALLSTVLYVHVLIDFIRMCIKTARSLMSLKEEGKKPIIGILVASGWITAFGNEGLPPEKEAFFVIVGHVIGYSILFILSRLLDVALPAIVACALPSILSLDKNLMVASLSLISAVAVLTCAVNTYCVEKLSSFKEEAEKYRIYSAEHPLNKGGDSDSSIHKQSVLFNTVDQSFIGPYGDHISPEQKTLKDAFHNENLLDNAYLVDTEVSQSSKEASKNIMSLRRGSF